jgi:hypothetical protein
VLVRARILLASCTNEHKLANTRKCVLADGLSAARTLLAVVAAEIAFEELKASTDVDPASDPEREPGRRPPEVVVLLKRASLKPSFLRPFPEAVLPDPWGRLP